MTKTATDIFKNISADHSWHDSLDKQLRLWAEGKLRILRDERGVRKLWNESTGLWVKVSEEFAGVLDQLDEANRQWHRSRHDRT